MNLGFNTDVRVGLRSFHVQTEDRGPHHGKIDTAVYAGGRVVHKLSTSYTELEGGLQATEAVRRARVEEQHRRIIDSLRAGTLKLDEYDLPRELSGHRAAQPGIAIEIANPASWLTGGQCDLQLRVHLRDTSHAPVAGAQLSVHFDGLADSPEITALCDTRGCARIQFPMPPGAADGAALVIRARSHAGDGEIRFHLRARKKTPVNSV
jgi:hypothetical protein